jgi:hypothetical protein
MTRKCRGLVEIRRGAEGGSCHGGNLKKSLERPELRRDSSHSGNRLTLGGEIVGATGIEPVTLRV